EFLHCYKENTLAMGLARVKTKHEIEKIEEGVLQLIFSYFESVDRIEEIQLLLETRGKFVEAANLGNEDHSVEGTFRRLWYIFFGSLWAHGKRALPLKNFKQKDELLNDLNLYVKDHPDSQDSELLLTEISVLSGAKISLPDMCRKYNGDKNDSYVVLDNKSQWVKMMNPIMVRKGYLYIIHAHEFSSVASRYWCSELLFVSEKVLKKLRFLHACSTDRENFSMHQETKILTSLFEVVKSLQTCKVPYSQKHADLIIDQYFQPFHISWKDAHSKEMRYLRGNEAFLKILNEAIKVNTNSQNDLTYGQLGRMAMIFLASKMTGFNDDVETKVRGSSENWRDLFAKLNGDELISRNEDLAISLHNVIEEAFSAGFLKVNMSPACFLFLMERLMILSFCYRGYVFIFNYFGIRKYNGDKNDSYVVLDNKSQWVKMMNPIMVRKGYLYIIHAHEFSSVASRYWCSELLFVSEKVLKKLRFLHACST
nr:DNA helicase, UvrD/REP type, P-loop containing nucleoside triphosphate hydrolase [Tanacetum cinerariifolium]